MNETQGKARTNMKQTTSHIVGDDRCEGGNPTGSAGLRTDTRTTTDLFGREPPPLHQSQLPPAENKFHVGNGDDGKHYWLTPPALYDMLDAEFSFTFDPCPFPKPDDFDGLTNEWGASNYVNPPFGSIVHHGKKKGPTAWVRKAIAEAKKGKRVVLVYPVDKWMLMLLEAGAEVRNLGDVRWLAIEDGSAGKGTGRHIACFILPPIKANEEQKIIDRLTKERDAAREYGAMARLRENAAEDARVSLVHKVSRLEFELAELRESPPPPSEEPPHD